MFVVNKDDLSIHATRGDIVCLNVSATDDRTGEPYEFQAGDILQMKIYAKKDAESVVLQKDFPVPAKTNTVGIVLTERDTKIGEVISKPVDYWYEVTLNPYTNPQTFIGYDEDGAKVFKLFPEGDDIPEYVPDPEELPKVVDEELDFTSPRPVENRAITRAIIQLEAADKEVEAKLTGRINALNEEFTKKSNYISENVVRLESDVAVERARIDNLVASPTPGDSELVDIRVGADGINYGSAGTAVREQFKNIEHRFDALINSEFSVNVFNKERATIGGYLNSSGKVNEASNTEYGYTELIKVKEGDVVNSLYSNNLVLYPGCLYYSDGTIKNVKDAGDYATNGNRQTFTVPSGVTAIRMNIKSSAIGQWMIVINNDYPVSYVPYSERITFTENVSVANSANVLNGKTWVVCGDSITYGAKADTDENGELKTYEYYIAKRNGMNLVVNAVSGSTMMNVAGKSPFSVDRYKALGDKADYITLAFVTNDSAQDVAMIGDISDTDNSTFYGAWNVVMKYLISTYPTAKIGIIGFWRGNQRYQYTDALRNLAQKYRVPFLDFMFDSNIPLVGGTDFRSYNPNAQQPYVDFDTLVARKGVFLADDVHPNDAGYQYISTIIENWLRGL